jgi:adenylyl-sulfate kinase
MNNHIYPIETKVSHKDRQVLMGQKPYLIWFTGLSGSGKSTLANNVEYYLYQNGVKTYLLDGDNVRDGLNKNLTFSEEDRKENLRRIGEVAKLMVDAGLVVLSSFISPYEKDRLQIKEIIGKDRYIEVYVDCPLEVCEQRDVKGLYKKARNGEIKNFTGIDSPYEIPSSPNLIIKTSAEPLENSIEKVLEYIIKRIK